MLSTFTRLSQLFSLHRPPAAASEEVRWMLRDERLQKVVAEVDAAPDAERVRLGGGGGQDASRLLLDPFNLFSYLPGCLLLCRLW